MAVDFTNLRSDWDPTWVDSKALNFAISFYLLPLAHIPS